MLEGFTSRKYFLPHKTSVKLTLVTHYQKKKNSVQLLSGRVSSVYIYLYALLFEMLALAIVGLQQQRQSTESHPMLQLIWLFER